MDDMQSGQQGDKQRQRALMVSPPASVTMVHPVNDRDLLASGSANITIIGCHLSGIRRVRT
jgi:hypothetical protein